MDRWAHSRPEELIRRKRLLFTRILCSNSPYTWNIIPIKPPGGITQTPTNALAPNADRFQKATIAAHEMLDGSYGCLAVEPENVTLRKMKLGSLLAEQGTVPF